MTDGELEWLQKDVEELISAEKSADMVTFLVKTHEELAQVRASVAKKVNMLIYLLYLSVFEHLFKVMKVINQILLHIQLIKNYLFDSVPFFSERINKNHAPNCQCIL